MRFPFVIQSLLPLRLLFCSYRQTDQCNEMHAMGWTYSHPFAPLLGIRNCGVRLKEVPKHATDASKHYLWLELLSVYNRLLSCGRVQVQCVRCIKSPVHHTSLAIGNT